MAKVRFLPSESPAKGVGGQKPREGSNPSHSATEEPPSGGFSVFGEMSERFKEPVLKTGDGATHRGFESHSLRHDKTPGFQETGRFVSSYSKMIEMCSISRGSLSKQSYHLLFQA